METDSTTRSREETVAAGRAFARRLRGGCIVALSGELGSGKTTFAQGILEELGAALPYTSPTFVIMKQYEPDAAKAMKSGIKRIYHVDAYRVESQSLAALGWAEWISDAQGVVVIEWPERVAELLPKRILRVSLTGLSEDTRLISAELFQEH